MKYIVGTIVAIGLIIVGGWFFLFSSFGYYSTTDYYVKITKNPEIRKYKADDGYITREYDYPAVPAYDKDGGKRNLNLTSQEAMKKNTYYLIQWEERRGVISSKKELKKDEITKNILKKLDQ